MFMDNALQCVCVCVCVPITITETELTKNVFKLQIYFSYKTLCKTRPGLRWRRLAFHE